METCDVFISYRREEGARVELLAQKLTSVGLKVWFDEHVSAGAVFDVQIADALKNAKALLVCWTPGAMESEWVRGEATMARGANKLVAAFLAPTELIPPFNLIHAENLTDWSGEDDHAGWAKILMRLASTSREPGLVEWAKMMGEGDARTLHAWIEAQPAGPLRNTTRYWLSTTNAQPIFGKTGAPAAKRPQSRGAGRVVGILALVVLLGSGGYLAMRKKEPSPQRTPSVPQPPIPGSSSSGTPPALSGGVSGVVPPTDVAPIKIADGTILHVPPGSLVDLETGRVSADDGPGYDFEIAVWSERYRINARGAAKIQMPDFEVAPNRRQFAEIPSRDFDAWAFFPVRGSLKKFQCFRTAEGHGGYLQLLKGDDKDLTTGVDFAVTFFR